MAKSSTSKTNTQAQVNNTATPVSMEQSMNNAITADITNIIARMDKRMDTLEQAFSTLTQVVANMATKTQNTPEFVCDPRRGRNLLDEAIAKETAVVGTPDAPLYVATGINASKKASKAGKPASKKQAKTKAKAEITKDAFGRPSNAKFHCECSTSAYGLSAGFADKHKAKGHNVIAL